MAGAVPFGCGQCLPCRVNRRRQWMWRQWFESLSHEENCFVTLTYDDAHLPSGENLEPLVLQQWLKRLRQALAPTRVRFFLCGEYGGGRSRKFNPHYHLSLFGVCGHTLVGGDRPRTVEQCIADTWRRGFISVAEFNEVTAQYVAGYVTKKLTQAGDPRLVGRVPEFARMSNRPGLGTRAMSVIADELTRSEAGAKYFKDFGDVPRSVRVGRRLVPLDRYLIRKLREAYGLTEEQIALIKGKATHDASLELLALYKDRLSVAWDKPITPRSTYSAQVEQKIRQVEARAALYKKDEKL